MKLVLDVDAYLKGKISTHEPREIELFNDSFYEVVIMLDCHRMLYFDANGYQCDYLGFPLKSPTYLLIERSEIA